MAMQKRTKKKVATKKRRSPPRKRIPDDFKFEIVPQAPDITPPQDSPPARQLAVDKSPASLRRLRGKKPIHTKGPAKTRDAAIKSAWTRDRHEHAE